MASATPCYDRAAMSILDFLGLKRSSPKPPGGDTETVRRIVGELEALEPERARYIAAFAYILSRVAHADLEISEAETAKMESLLQKLGGMPEHQAVLAVQIAKAQSRLAGGTENFLVTREFREIATREQCLELLDCLFAVSAADDSISGAEESQIRQIASELGFSLNEYVAVRSAYSDKREILRSLRREEQGT
ncbi:MAG TPA: TerB family tellurite resistance protein [Thermoanaerobaculia bacterium]|nr:TerB family tellurite resistance protein [Thermoanaerobaculia bacterium]